MVLYNLCLSGNYVLIPDQRLVHWSTYPSRPSLLKVSTSCSQYRIPYPLAATSKPLIQNVYPEVSVLITIVPPLLQKYHLRQRSIQ